MSKQKIRNVAIVAHVDHGKTTLLDGILNETKVFRENQDIPERVMDSYDQERERGITIFSKNTSVDYKENKINIIDTPGHADFSGEVERILGMVNAVLLVVDAREGPMPQTRFVVSKFLKMGLPAIVVVNKVDRPHSDPDKALNDVFDLFVELGANDEQLDFAHCYASALNGWAIHEIGEPEEGFSPLLDLVLDRTPAPDGEEEEPFLMQVATLSYDDFRGRQCCGRILSGSVRCGDRVERITPEGQHINHTVTGIRGYQGLDQIELQEASVGHIVSLSGLEEVMIGDTVCAPGREEPLPAIRIDEPTVSIDIVVNDGPMVGRSGKHVTMNKIRDRLLREARSNISYRVVEDPQNQAKITIVGRGELHLSILLEAMRREGYEFCVSKPKVVMKEEEGRRLEPIQRVHIEVPEEHAGGVIEHLSRRKGELQHLEIDEHGIQSMDFLIPTRGVMGFRNDFLTMTKGLGIMTSLFDSYADWKGEIPHRSKGVLISMNAGKATAYSAFNLESRGRLFIAPGDEVYEGMIVGEHNRDSDLIVNIIKGKQLTNVRASGSDENVVLAPPTRFTLEQSIGFLHDDELLEVTPDALRLRKQYLSENERLRATRKR